MREHRPRHSMLPEEERRKDNARSYANVYKRRGKIELAPCKKCGSPDSEMHHPDYGRPLDVEFFCRPCHLEHHRDDPKPL